MTAGEINVLKTESSRHIKTLQEFNDAFNKLAKMCHDLYLEECRRSFAPPVDPPKTDRQALIELLEFFGLNHAIEDILDLETESPHPRQRVSIQYRNGTCNFYFNKETGAFEDSAIIV